MPAAVDSLAAAGFRIERPPEDWLFKAWWDDSLVDVLHRLRGVTGRLAELIATAEEIEVLGVRIPVLPPTPIMIAKLQSLSEHYGDFGALLPAVRAVREQLDWAAGPGRDGPGPPLRRGVPAARDRLGIADPGSQSPKQNAPWSADC